MRVGRYQVFREIARGGMGTVHLGRLSSDFGVGRLVAVKRLHAHVAADPQFVKMFLDEARLCARIRHRNVVSLLDLVSNENELYMMLEYVEGETLGKLLDCVKKAGERVPDRVVAGLVAGALHGLHAAHEAKAEDGSPLGVVHRDFTPQNVLVGVDGVARVADFGVAKAAVRLQTTRDGELKGKLAYMAPEQVSGGEVDRRTDIFAAGVVLWEVLTTKRLFSGQSEAEILMKIVRGAIDPASDHAPGLHPTWDRILERALSLSPEGRFATAREMAIEIETAFPSASSTEIGEWVSRLAQASLEQRAVWVAEVERAPQNEPLADSAPSAKSFDKRSTESQDTREVETQVASPQAISRPTSSFRVGKAGVAALVLGLVGSLGVWWVASSSEARSSAAREPPIADSAAPTVSATAAEPRPASEPVVVPTPSSEASALPEASGSSKPVATLRRVPAVATTAKATAAGPQVCKYFDEKEKIWKWRACPK